MDSENVVVNYITKRAYCHCCGQKLKNPKTSEVREFYFTVENLKDWSDDWKDIAEYDDDLQEVIREFVYDTIQFFATNSHEAIYIEDCEFDKVKEFVLSKVINS